MMRKITFFLSLLAAFAGAVTADAQMYRATTRAATLENGKQYMLYNTTITGSDNRTGFLFNNGSNLGHSGSPKKFPSTFVAEKKYLWEIETTDTEYKYYMKSVSTGTYVGPAGATNNENGRDLYIQPWETSQCPKAGVKSQNEDERTETEAADITSANKVFTICGTSVESNKQANGSGDCWNGNPDGWAKWASAHPYAFYEIEEVATAEDVAAWEKAKTDAETLVSRAQSVFGLVKDAGKYSSNAVEPKEGSLANLLDGEYTTFFHSSWSVNVNGEHYLQADLIDPTDDIRIFFKKRDGNNNNRPTEILVQGSNDGTTFTDIKTIAEGLPTDANVLCYVSDNIQSDTPYQYYRFVVKQTNTGAKNGDYVFFTFSEFYVLPGNDELVNSICDVYNEVYSLDYLDNFKANLAAALEKIRTAEQSLSNLTRVVKIEHYFGGELSATTQTEAAYGETVTVTADFATRYGVSCAETEKSVTVGNETTVRFDYTWNTSEKPFEVSMVAGNAELTGVNWYYLTQRGKYSRYDAGDNKIKSGSTERDYLLYKDLFAFEGNPIKGYKIYNYVTGAEKVLGGEVSNNAHVTMMVDEADTERFVLENNSNHLVFRKDGTELGYLNDISGAIGYWVYSAAATDAGSTFTFVAVSAEELSEIPVNEIKASLDVAIANAKRFTGSIGTGYNAYSQQEGDEDFATAVTDAETFKNSITTANAETKSQAENWINKLNTLVEHLTINMPAAKSFVRVRCANGNRRLLSEVEDGTGKLKLADTTESNSIFYYDGTHLLAYLNGLYVWNKPVNNSANIVYAEAGEAGGEIVFADGRGIQVGTYTVKCGNRYLFGSGDIIDSGAGTDTRTGYTWWIEKVDQLPVTIGTTKFATLWSPVTLTIPAGVTAYTATLSGDILVLEEVSGVIPAETGVVLNGEAGNYNFAVSAETASADKGSLTGTVNTIPATDSEYYTLQSVNDNEVGFKLYNGTTVSGFKARLAAEVGTTLQTIRMTFGTTTGIEGATTADSRDTAIYDLNGRRVEAPAKGLYIVNGQKVLFK
ncbi:MAG: discoidin domain-containing protein [Prevotellaceae bacterium]|nr:discoidin domain-containing protein [Prevotellaceae bacterium]